MPDSAATVASEVRPAATLMLLRDGAGGVEVLMMQRHAASAFAAGVWVFPGGRVDAGDGAMIPGVDSAPSDDTASDIVGVAAGGRAFWVAAARECFEEAGILLASYGSVGPDGTEREGTGTDPGALLTGRLPRLRLELLAGACSFGDLIAGEGLVLTLGDVHLVSRWVTPPGPPRRFDTRFFVAPAPPGQEPSHDTEETVAWVWTTPAQAFARCTAGEIELMRPTMAQLASLAAFDSTADVLAAVRRVGPVIAVRPERPRGPITPELEMARAGEGRWPT